MELLHLSKSNKTVSMEANVKISIPAKVVKLLYWLLKHTWYVAASKFDNARYNKLFWIVYNKAGTDIFKVFHGDKIILTFSSLQNFFSSKFAFLNRMKKQMTSFKTSDKKTAVEDKYGLSLFIAVFLEYRRTKTIVEVCSVKTLNARYFNRKLKIPTGKTIIKHNVYFKSILSIPLEKSFQSLMFTCQCFLSDRTWRCHIAPKY